MSSAMVQFTSGNVPVHHHAELGEQRDHLERDENVDLAGVRRVDFHDQRAVRDGFVERGAEHDALALPKPKARDERRLDVALFDHVLRRRIFARFAVLLDLRIRELLRQVAADVALMMYVASTMETSSSLRSA